MQDFRNLEVWQKSHELTLAVYRVSLTFPDYERFGLASQLRRGAPSIPANLAEGCGRGSDADFGRFVQNAMGSASEASTTFSLPEILNDEITRIKKMLASLLRKVRGN